MVRYLIVKTMQYFIEFIHQFIWWKCLFSLEEVEIFQHYFQNCPTVEKSFSGKIWPEIQELSSFLSSTNEKINYMYVRQEPAQFR